jgi:hypothetical protein
MCQILLGLLPTPVGTLITQCAGSPKPGPRTKPSPLARKRYQVFVRAGERGQARSGIVAGQESKDRKQDPGCGVFAHQVRGAKMGHHRPGSAQAWQFVGPAASACDRETAEHNEPDAPDSAVFCTGRHKTLVARAIRILPSSPRGIAFQRVAPTP